MTEAHPATTGPIDLDAIEARVDAHADTVEDVRALVAELRAARFDRAYFEGRLELANDVIDAYREYAPGSMPMVDARLRHYDATAEGGS